MDMNDMAFNIFNELRLEGQLCDVIIKVDGVEFKAHKNILCAISSYFRALFTSGWNNKRSVYTIPGTTPEMMTLIIEFAYTGALPVSEDNVEKLLEAADQFCISEIVQACCQFLEWQLCPENCIGICKFAAFYSCTELQRKALLFTLRHFDNMVEVSQEFLQLSQAQLCDLIEKDNLNANEEDQVYQAILRWVSHDVSNRKHSLPVLLPKVRMALMSPKNILNSIKNHPLVKESLECKNIVIRGLKALYELNMHGPSNLYFGNPMSRPRLPHNILLAIGGWSAGSPTNVIEAYDTKADRWVTVAQNDTIRAYHGAVYLDGFVYCIGGFDSVDYFNNVRKFNPITRTWHQVAPMHSRRCYVSVAVLGRYIYAMGGFDGCLRIKSVERYDPETNQWTLVAPMHESRSDAGAASLNGQVYICGGFNGRECLISAESYCPNTNQWTLIKHMTCRRTGLGVAVYHNKLYAVGGFNGASRLETAEVYNPVINSWLALPAMSSPRSNFGIAVVDNLLYVVGGFNGFNTSINVTFFNDKTNEWYDAQDMATVRSALSCCVLPGLPNVADYIVPRDRPLTCGDGGGTPASNA